MALLPFLFPDQIKKWNKMEKAFTELKERIEVPSILLLIPDMTLWNIPFTEWSDEDKQHKCYSGLWDIEANRVLWMAGVVTREAIMEQGKTVEELMADERGGTE
jgi:hypothetical protein